MLRKQHLPTRHDHSKVLHKHAKNQTAGRAGALISCHLGHEVTLVVPAGHPQYSGARKRRLCGGRPNGPHLRGKHPENPEKVPKRKSLFLWNAVYRCCATYHSQPSHSIQSHSTRTLLHRHRRTQKHTRGQHAHACPLIHAHRTATTTHNTRCDSLKLS